MRFYIEHNFFSYRKHTLGYALRASVYNSEGGIIKVMQDYLYKSKRAIKLKNTINIL